MITKTNKTILKMILGAMIVIATAISARAEIQISQVMYDPAGTQSGGEFVQLENAGASAVDIGGLTIATSVSDTDVIIPANTTILAGSRFLIADKGWNQSRDNMSWPLADLEDTMTMANFNSGIAIKRNGTIIDAVGWGNVSNNDLFRGTPTTGAPPGQSLRRIASTGSNKDDFVAGIPYFGSGSQQGGGVELSVEVVNTPDHTNISLMVPDEDQKQGTQVIPFPGTTKLVRVNLTIDGVRPDSFTVSAFGEESNFSSTDNGTKVELNIPLRYDVLPGTYVVSLNAKKGQSTTGSATTTIEILPVLSVSLDSTTIPLGQLRAGSSISISGDENLNTTDKPTIWNSGNTPATISLIGSDLVSSSGTIPATNVQVTLVSSSRAIDSIAMSGTSQQIGAGLSVRSNAGLDFSINVPSSTQPGRYIAKMWLLASRGE